jgi:hypothetical protein
MERVTALRVRKFYCVGINFYVFKSFRAKSCRAKRRNGSEFQTVLEVEFKIEFKVS